MPYPALHQIEHVIDGIEELLIQRLNPNLELVYRQHEDVAGTGKINLPVVAPGSYYKSEIIEPKVLPACFIIGDRTIHDLNSQNFDLQEHQVFVAVLAEDKEYGQLTRKMWRYGEALFQTLRDAAVGDARLLVEEVSYSPTYGGTGYRDVRHFRKDVSVRVRVRHYDVIP